MKQQLAMRYLCHAKSLSGVSGKNRGGRRGDKLSNKSSSRSVFTSNPTPGDTPIL